jgi:cold-inducible RNA-binding protein
MATKLYIGNLSYATQDDGLNALFSQVGTVVSATVVKDRETGRSRGFAFVEMASAEDADKAIQRFNGYKLDNRELRVSIARPKEDRPSGGGYDRRPRSSSSNRSGGSDRRRSGGDKDSNSY